MSEAIQFRQYADEALRCAAKAATEKERLPLMELARTMQAAIASEHPMSRGVNYVALGATIAVDVPRFSHQINADEVFGIHSRCQCDRVGCHVVLRRFRHRNRIIVHGFASLVPSAVVSMWHMWRGIRFKMIRRMTRNGSTRSDRFDRAN
jgi:hypothetical protein